MTKTNVVRLLESAGVPFSAIEYEVDEDALDAVTVAAKVGRDADSVFKTLVARTDAGEVSVFVIPGSCELDLKKAAKAAGGKSLSMVKVAELQGLTGYVRGGCSPLGMKRKYPVYVDETARLFPDVSVSAGIRGMQVILSPDDLASLASASWADLI